jgi:TATA-binding protein-associated factor
VQAEKHASGFSDGSDDAGSALPRTDSAATSDLAYMLFQNLRLYLHVVLKIG